MNNYSNEKKIKYFDNNFVKSILDTNPTLTEKSIEKNPEIKFNNSTSKKFYSKNFIPFVKNNKSSKSSQYSGKQINLINNLKINNKEIYKNSSIEMKNSINPSKRNNYADDIHKSGSKKLILSQSKYFLIN